MYVIDLNMHPKAKIFAKCVEICKHRPYDIDASLNAAKAKADLWKSLKLKLSPNEEYRVEPGGILIISGCEKI